MRKSKILEKGNIYFFYRPKVNRTEVKGFDDISRMYMILSPEKKKETRLVLIGQKFLPKEKTDKESKNWAFVDVVSKNPKEVEVQLHGEEYQTKTRGTRHRPISRPAGEGVYTIVKHDGHTHLAYVLELPEKTKKVQRELNIAKESNYIISVKNPQKPSPRGAGLRKEQKANYPKKLNDKFKDYRFISLDPADFLDYEGCELVLIETGKKNGKDLGIKIDTQRETENTADIVKELRMDLEKHPVKPLFAGEWE